MPHVEWCAWKSSAPGPCNCGPIRHPDTQQAATDRLNRQPLTLADLDAYLCAYPGLTLMTHFEADGWHVTILSWHDGPWSEWRGHGLTMLSALYDALAAHGAALTSQT